MSVDAQFPTLEAVAAFLDKDAPPESPKVTVDEDKVQQAVKYVETVLSSGIYDEPGDRLNTDDDLTIHDERIREDLDEIWSLRHKRDFLKKLVTLEKQMEDPAAHAGELVATRSMIRSAKGDEGLAMWAERGIELVDRWYAPELTARLANWERVLASAGWPRTPLPRGSETVGDALRACIALDPDAPFAALAAPFTASIRYNFQESADTARSDRPEWLFAYVVKLLSQQAASLRVVQHFVDHPTDRFVRALMPVLVETCRSTYSVTPHFVSELIQFAETLKTKFWCGAYYDTTFQLVDVCSDLVRLVMEDRVGAYLELEERVQTGAVGKLIATGSRKIDFDADVPCAKPMFLAVNVADLLVDTRRLAVLSPAAVPRVSGGVVRTFLEFLQAERELYDRTHSSLARAVGTAQVERDGAPVPPDAGDAQRLAQIYGSASFFVLTLERRQLDLVVACNHKAKTLFAEFVDAFVDVRAFAAARLAKLLSRDVQRLLKHYFRVDWQHNPAPSTAIMQSTVASLKPSIEFLNRLCPTARADRARITVPLAESLAKMFWRMVIQANLFTSEAARLLADDIETLWTALDLPLISAHLANLEATQVLQGSTEASELTEDDVDGLVRRRLTT